MAYLHVKATVDDFDEEENARARNDYLREEGKFTEPEMADVDVSYLDLREQKALTPA